MVHKTKAINHTNMKNKMHPLKKFVVLLLLASVVQIPSCKLRETNVNPNASEDAPLSAILSGAQASLAFSAGIDGILSATVVQHTHGSNGDAVSNDNYNAQPSRFNGVWNNNYTAVLHNLNQVVKKGRENNSPYYVGVAQVLQAWTFGTLTDLFGDIPFSEALQGSGNISPKFDAQQDVYQGIQTLLDSGIANLSKPTSSFVTPPPTNDDLIFRGNINNWLAAAWTLKARYALHLTKVDPAAASNALGFLYNGATYRGIASNTGDAQVVFGAAQTNANPYFQQNTNRPGWVGLGAAVVNLLKGNNISDDPTLPVTQPNDPRIASLATTYTAPSAPPVYRGARAGVPGAFSLIGSYYGQATSPVVLVSYSEAKLIEAEARIRINAADPLAQTALNDAIDANFNKVITNAADTNNTVAKKTAYKAAKATLTGTFTDDLEKIITQKYIALFLQHEVWVDYRRTGLPALTPAVGGSTGINPGGQIPRRFPYPQSEQNANANLPGASSYQTPKLWWDQ
jgi:hypothetical protein